MFTNAQVRPALNKAQAPLSVRPVVRPTAFTTGLIGQGEGLDRTLNSVHAIESPLDARIILRLAALIALSDITLTGARLTLRGSSARLQPFEAIHKRPSHLFSPVLAAQRLGGHVHGAFGLLTALIPHHHIKMAHEGPAQAHVVPRRHHILQGDDDTHARRIRGRGVSRVDDAAHPQPLNALHQGFNALTVRVVAVQNNSAPVDNVTLAARLSVVEETARNVVAPVFGGPLPHVLRLEEGHELVGGEPTLLH